jgi:hypothetical protein
MFAADGRTDLSIDTPKVLRPSELDQPATRAVRIRGSGEGS